MYHYVVSLFIMYYPLNKSWIHLNQQSDLNNALDQCH